MMPVMGGAEFLQKLRALSPWKDLPVLLFSATGSCVTVHGATGFIKKPVHLHDLLSAVESHCGKV
jgi:CheY-like chemotaxis protein